MSHATVERYLKLFAANDLASVVFHRVTSALIEALELDISRQRLDSTHLYSDMATFGRTKLMGVTIKRFLTQLKRHHGDLYEALDQDFLARYAPSQAKLFGDFTGSRSELGQTVAEDLLLLVSRFADHEQITRRDSYQAMERVLHEQCDVEEETVELKKKTGGDVMQNPSDPNAGFYNAITCNAGNDAETQPGSVTIVGNTIYGIRAQNQWTGPCYGIRITSTMTYKQQNFVIKNNIINKMHPTASNYNIEVTYAPSNWVANGNIYDANGDWKWNGTRSTSLASWQSASG
ncbi:hypothetical protein LCGC14_3169500, partial [marine sediment metagenome]